MDITDLSKPMPDEKSRAYRVPVDPAWFQERDCVVITPMLEVKEAFTPKVGETIQAFPLSEADQKLFEARLWIDRRAAEIVAAIPIE